MVKAWLAFANSFDPNRSNRKCPPLPTPVLFPKSNGLFVSGSVPNWPKYGEQRQMLQIENGTSGSSVIIDDFRKDGIEFFESKEWADAFNF
jgi:hypothetical protein